MNSRNRFLGLALAAAAGALAGCGDSGSSAVEPAQAAEKSPAPAAAAIVPPALPAAVATAAAPAGVAPVVAPPVEGGPAYDPAKATGGIKATVKYTGNLPKMRPVKFDADPECGKQHTSAVPEETVAGKDGKLQNVIVYVSKGFEKWSYKAPADPVVLDQKGCMYVPHVFTVMAGQPIAIKNSDPVMHNVHAIPKVNKEFNRSQLKGSKDLSEKFDKPELPVIIKCDVHGWMKSWAGVFAHPFHAVTGEDGTAAIKLPAGEYEISVWHEKLAVPAMQKVTVAEGAVKDVEFTFEIK